jgi:hypothetical protein
VSRVLIRGLIEHYDILTRMGVVQVALCLSKPKVKVMSMLKQVPRHEDLRVVQV